MTRLNEWFSDSLIKTVACLAPELISVWMTQLMNDSDSLIKRVAVYSEWISVLNDSVKWMIQWLTHKDSRLFSSEWISVLNDSVKLMIQWSLIKTVACLAPEWISVLNDSVDEWFSDSLVKSRLFSSEWISVLNDSVDYDSWLTHKAVLV